MNKLPDGSGFFVMSVGERENHGLVSRLKYHRKGYARKWLFRWRCFHYAYREADDPLTFWKSVKWAFMV